MYEEGDHPRETKATWLLLAGLVLLGAGLRFGTLGLQSFWYDEAATGYIVALPEFGDVLDRVADTESTPPLYYLATWVATKLAGQGDLALRSVSALSGTAAIPVAWATARRLADARAGLLAAAFVALSPLLLNYSQEARAYGLVTLLCAGSFYLMVRCLDRPSRWNLAGWALVSSLALATHYFAVFTLAAEAAVLLWRVRPRWQAAIACAGPVLAGALLVPLFLEQRSHGSTDWITASPLTSRVKDTGHQFIKGVVEAPGAGLGALAFAVVAVAAVFVFIAPADRRRAALLCFGVGAASLVLPLVLAAGGADVFLFRNLQGAFVPLAVGLAIGLSTRRLGLVVGGALCLVWAGIWVGVLRDDGLHRDDWEGAAARLAPPREARGLAIAPGYAGAPLGRYGHFGQPVGEAPIRVRELVVIGVYDSRQAAPRYVGMRLTKREQVQRIGIAIYRSRKQVALNQAQFAPPGSPPATTRLHLEQPPATN